MQIVNESEMKSYEKAAMNAGISEELLMENAGMKVADFVETLTKNGIITVLIGPGNNGGDGLVTARYLSDEGYEVNVVYTAERKPDDINAILIHKDCYIEEYIWSDTEDNDDIRELFEQSTIVVDGIFGTGQNRKISGIYKELCEALNEAKTYNKELLIVAIDVPTGVNCTTGNVDESAVKCDYTITLGLPKIGLFNEKASLCAGKILVRDIFTINEKYEFESPTLIDNFDSDKPEFLSAYLVNELLPERNITSHKGTYGKLLSITGSSNYPGAAVLSSGAAIRSGLGLLCHAANPLIQQIMAVKYPEITYIENSIESICENINKYDAVLTGCGLGNNEKSTALVESVLQEAIKNNKPLVLDADALNILSQNKNLLNTLNNRMVLTPHAAEFSHLTGLSVEEIQNNRINLAIKYAKEWNVTLVLKGAYTVIANYDGRCSVSPFANSLLSTAGTGDVLAGIIASFIAQGSDGYVAALCGVYIHGEAAEEIKHSMGISGMIASDLIAQIPYTMNNIRNINKHSEDDDCEDEYEDDECECEECDDSHCDCCCDECDEDEE